MSGPSPQGAAYKANGELTYTQQTIAECDAMVSTLKKVETIDPSIPVAFYRRGRGTTFCIWAVDHAAGVYSFATVSQWYEMKGSVPVYTENAALEFGR